jgi:hypothetical protein
MISCDLKLWPMKSVFPAEGLMNGDLAISPVNCRMMILLLGVGLPPLNLAKSGARAGEELRCIDISCERAIATSEHGLYTPKRASLEDDVGGPVGRPVRLLSHAGDARLSQALTLCDSPTHANLQGGSDVK